jgi:hypothetical protein
LDPLFCYPPVVMSAHKILLLILISFLAGCRGGRNSTPPIPADKFAEIYIGLLAAGGREHDSTGAVITAPTDSILRHWGVTQEYYRATVEHYNRDPEHWREFFSEVIRKGTPGERE